MRLHYITSCESALAVAAANFQGQLAGDSGHAFLNFQCPGARLVSLIFEASWYCCVAVTDFKIPSLFSLGM